MNLKFLRRFRRGVTILLLCACLLLPAGCLESEPPVSRSGETDQPQIEDDLAPGTETDPGDPAAEQTENQGVYFRAERKPAAFQNTALLPTQEQRPVNEESATYERLGLNAEEKRASEQEAAGSTQFPVIFISTRAEDEILSRETYVSCVIDVLNCAPEQELREASAGVRVRGNASAYYGDEDQIRENPVPYRIRFDERTNLLGLNGGAKNKSWVLLKVTNGIIRDDLCLRYGRSIVGQTLYCTDAQMVLLYVNDELQGLYLCCEQNQVDRRRVNISKPEPGYTGTDIGYYVELDQYGKLEDNPSFVVDYGEQIMTDIEGVTAQFSPSPYSIKSDVYAQGQIDFIDRFVNGVFTILYEAGVNDRFLTFDENYELVESDYRTAQETVGAVLDLHSAVNMYLLYELAHDYDCGEGSFFMCVDFHESVANPKLQFTSPWDFSWTLDGRTDRYWAGAFCTDSFRAMYGDRANPWFIVLTQQDWFREMASERWTSLRGSGAIDVCLEEELAFLEAHQEEIDSIAGPMAKTTPKAIQWVRDRIAWMDTQFLLEELP